MTLFSDLLNRFLLNGLEAFLQLMEERKHGPVVVLGTIFSDPLSQSVHSPETELCRYQFHSLY